MRPRTIVYNATSVDGRITGFDADLEAYYGEAMNWPTDAVLVGSNTIITSEEGFDKEDKAPSRSYKKKEGVLIVIPDSHGRIKNFRKLREVPYWGEIAVLCSESTPKDHIAYLESRKVEHLIAGKEHVDMVKAMDWLAKEHGVENLRVDSGGILNGVLLEQGLVDEVHVMVHPQMVGGTAHGSMFKATHEGKDTKINLELKKVEKKGKDLVLLSYEVVR
ncbi:MAG: 2,5-diamino-6-ribosylamino-4(3H)-pyrimidinone 5'-phosphate reductase [Methanomassiliicoccales archaeon PtaU1.Bin124]|nr:MAG: 2,5-diamino-6-ribosylamino-4(3H)-pyrimidinone 5'-phosphate reductase [Methanomassiliicoccales archaeon PtaU1.Bin124]